MHSDVPTQSIVWYTGDSIADIDMYSDLTDVALYKAVLGVAAAIGDYDEDYDNYAENPLNQDYQNGLLDAIIAGWKKDDVPEYLKGYSAGESGIFPGKVRKVYEAIYAHSLHKYFRLTASDYTDAGWLPF